MPKRFSTRKFPVPVSCDMLSILTGSTAGINDRNFNQRNSRLNYRSLVFTIMATMLAAMPHTVTGAESIAAREIWSNGPSTDPEFFPIGVWLQAPSLASRYREAGVNLYVGLWDGPTENQLATLRKSGMQVICAQNSVALRHLDDSAIVGWLQADEPDNAQRQIWGYWNEIPPDEIVDRYRVMRSRDPTRPILLNLGQGVANDEWTGRAADKSDYAHYLQGADIVSFDVYPVAGIDKEDGGKYLWYLARGIERLYRWGKDEKPVWSMIETTGIESGKAPTPQQVESEVWMALIHGARGIVYFAHEWVPEFNDARLLDDREMLTTVTRINRQIHSLAPVLNSDARIAVDIESEEPLIPVSAIGKRHGDDIYLFSIPLRYGKTRAVFKIPGMKGKAIAEVIGENRYIEVVDGVFEDRFGNFEVHRYRMTLEPEA